MNSNKKHLQIAELHKNEKNKLIEKLNTEYPYRLRNEIKKIFNNNEDDITKYDSERALIKKKISSITQKIKYNEDLNFREKNNNDIKIRREKKKILLQKQKEDDEKIELQNTIIEKDNQLNKKDEVINNKDDIIFEQQKLIKDDKKTIFNLNILCKDLQYEIKNLKESYKNTNNNSDKISSSSSSNSSTKKERVNINYSEIKELSDYKLNKFLCSMGYKYNDIKEISFHEKKQLFNKNNNDKINRLFNK